MHAVMTRHDEREIGRLITVVVALALTFGLVGLVALRSRAPRPTPTWVPFDGPTFQVEMPVAPVTRSVGPGTGAATAVVRQTAYTAVWYPVPTTTPPAVALQRALAIVGRAPARVLSSRELSIGPYSGADIVVRMPRAFLHGRILEARGRGYLVAEIAPTADPPADLTRLLQGFNPD